MLKAEELASRQSVLRFSPSDRSDENSQSTSLKVRVEMPPERRLYPPSRLTEALFRAKMSGLRRLIPLLDRVLVEKVTPPSKSVGGVLLPETIAGKVNPGAAHGVEGSMLSHVSV